MRTDVVMLAGRVTDAEVDRFIDEYDNPELMLWARSQWGYDIRNLRVFMIRHLLERFVGERVQAAAAQPAAQLDGHLSVLAEFLRKPGSAEVLRRIVAAEEAERRQ